ncbi:Crp/Fnr family transcriptional regulator [Flagellimonas meridianipacifica]|uniref:CRP-like cAMP-binding protein n=1 Tax=Flagellimonas meridianipacifica TaxID=1080225 RepID=A0A2T0MII9_9FLAO|nr:cyclic nucleotide-binding domain-containing protein [Allomuricauda pacifica]PRX57404.1 CRP-like cAMP-binding protein [Allomuricauda pacifica]
MINLKTFLNQIHQVDDDILNKYLEYWQEYHLPKKTTMTAPGEMEKHWYFVTKGVQKSFYLTGDKTHVIAFTYNPSFSGIPESFFQQKPSKYYLETITESSFLRIPFQKHQELMQEYRPIETLFRVAIEKILFGLLDRYYELMALDIETRFKNFTARSPHLLQMVSQKDLASYLRIDPTNFSKLMNSVRI